MKTCSQILSTKSHQDIISIEPNCYVIEALSVLAEHKIGAVAVIEKGQILGIFSERDYAREIKLKGRTAEETLIKDVMTTNLITCKPNDLVDSAMSMMSEKRIRHLPVMDGDKIIGILSIGDLVKETISYQQELIEQLELYIRSG